MAPPYQALSQFPGNAQTAITGWLDDWGAEPIVQPIDPWWRPGDLTYVRPGAKLISLVNVPEHTAEARAWGGTWQFDRNTGLVMRCNRAMWQIGTFANTFEIAEWDPSAFNMAPETMSVELGNIAPLAMVAMLNGCFSGAPADKNGNAIDNGGTLVTTDQIYGGSLAVLQATAAGSTTGISPWTTGDTYAKGQKVTSNGNVYTAGTGAPGTAGATAPSGTTTSSDGTITWTYLFASSMQAQKLVNPAKPGYLSGSSWYNAHEVFPITPDNVILAIENQQVRPAMNGVELGLGDEGIEVWVPFSSKEKTRQIVEVFRQLPGTGITGSTPVQVPITGGGSQVIYSMQDNPAFGRAKVRAISGLRSDLWFVVSPRPRPRPQYSLFIYAQGGKVGQWKVQTQASAMQNDSVPHLWVKQWTEDSPMFAGSMPGVPAGSVGISMLLNEGFAFGSGMLLDACFTGYAS